MELELVRKEIEEALTQLSEEKIKLLLEFLHQLQEEHSETASRERFWSLAGAGRSGGEM